MSGGRTARCSSSGMETVCVEASSANIVIVSLTLTGPIDGGSAAAEQSSPAAPAVHSHVPVGPSQVPRPEQSPGHGRTLLALAANNGRRAPGPTLTCKAPPADKPITSG